MRMLPILFILLHFFVTDGESLQKSFEARLWKLRAELLRDLRIQNSSPMNMNDFNKTLRMFGITDSIQSLTSCTACQVAVNEIMTRPFTAEAAGRAICSIHFLLQTWKPSTFCNDIIQLHLPIITFILQNSKILDPKLVCSIVLQNRACYHESEALNWSIKVHQRNGTISPQVTFPNKNSKPLKVLHLTDIHITPDYEVGSSSTCGYPLCCKEGLASNLHDAIDKKRAGKWGDYNCDIPLWLFGNLIQHIQQFHKGIDLIYFTGDVIDHSIWSTSVKNNSELLYWTYKQFHEAFPKTIVLPVIGNHETSPINSFAPSHPDVIASNVSTQWLYTLMSKLWSPWLSRDALATVKQEGYYAFNFSKALKVIALNNNVCYHFNWWLLYDTKFLLQQLAFLKKELEDSESRGQFVHILSHIPPGNKECIQPWEKSYNALIRRFAPIIKGQFFGHEHTDELKIFYDQDNKTPINVGFNGGALTPYTNYNPNYKIMTVDSDTYEILDIDTFIFNLTDANLNPNRTPAWFKSYSMKDAYGLNDLSPQSINQFVEQMFNDGELYCEYWRNYVKYGDASLESGCKQSNKKEILCKIITAESLAPPKKYCL